MLKLHGLNDLSKEFFGDDSGSVITYDSYMISNDDADSRQQRLLDVDNKVYLPVETNVRILVTSADVLHS
jgi:heme/copper-type cytochrome/quinol oxidase subunit 2